MMTMMRERPFPGRRGRALVIVVVVIVISVLALFCQAPPSTLTSAHLSDAIVSTTQAKEQQGSSTLSSSLFSSSTSINRQFPFCNTTNRCQPIHQQEDLISYVHISKNAGSSWIQELKRLQGISPNSRAAGPDKFTLKRLYPLKPAGPEHSVLYQDALLQQYTTSRNNYLRMLTLRSPRHHMWSLFSHCYYSNWGRAHTYGTNFPRSTTTINDDDDKKVLDDFHAWLLHFANDTAIHRRKSCFQCYHPANFQSRALVVNSKEPHRIVDDIWEPPWEQVNQTYWSLDWVSLTGFFHESKCLLYYRVHLGSNKKSKASGEVQQDNVATSSMVRDYLDQKCRCDKQPQPSHSPSAGPAASNTTARNISDHDDELLLQDFHDAHAAKGHRSSLLDLPADTLQWMDVLTNIDAALYRLALEQFLLEIQWLESGLGRRILCDSVTQRWDQELAYLYHKK